MENNLVKVLLWGQEVGVMYWDASASRAIFEYSPDYLRMGVDIAPLTCSIQSIAAKKPILGNKEKIYQGLTSSLKADLPNVCTE